MTDRPTPEQIINDIMVDALREHGYVIVHPDDQISGIEYCAEHGGILTEGTDYHPDGLGCEYAENESDEPCHPTPLYFNPTPTEKE